MKALKYAIISLLIITTCKRLTPSDQINNQNNEIIKETMIEKSKKEPKKISKNRHNDRDIQHKKRYRSTVKKYNSDTKIARTDNLYVGVYEYNKATTPPDITIPAMVPFGTIKKKPYQEDSKLVGRKFNITTLWGIPVHGHRKPIKESEKNLTIGYLWLNQDSIFGVAQMNDGKTFIGVIDDHQPNYIKTQQHELGKTGPIWTWYTEDDSKNLIETYGISKPSLSNVKEIGLAKINRQRYKLYGIQIPNLDHIALENQKTLPVFASNFMKTTSSHEQKTNFFNLQKNNDAQQSMHPLILSLLAKSWYDKNNKS